MKFKVVNVPKGHRYWWWQFWLPKWKPTLSEITDLARKTSTDKKDLEEK